MPLEHYIHGDVIGKGSYGEVSLARHKKDKKQYVIKKIDLHNASAKERTFAQQEVDILSKLRHPNIVSYKESYQTPDGHLAIVMGFCEGGDLYCKLKKQLKEGEYLSETQVVEWFVQIAMALQYMHDRHILHRDLKTQNIFLTKSKIIKLGDLGIARVLENNVDMATTMIGTPYYMSPELFSNKPYNHKSDVWALGCCVYEMATLKHAFNAKDMNSLVYKILKGKTPPMPKNYSYELQEIIKSMLNYDPTQRPSASRILRHPFIKKHIAIFLEGTKNRRKIHEERPEKKIPKINSESSIGSNVDPQVIATASKVEIQLVDEQQDEKKKESDQKIHNNEAHSNSRDNEISGVRKDITKDNLYEIPVDSSNNNNNVVKKGCEKNKPSHVRKVLSDRVHTKVRLKKRESDEINTKKEYENFERVSSASSQEDNTERKHVSPRKRRQEHSKRPLPVCPPDVSNESPRLPPPRFKNEVVEERDSKADVEEVPKVSAGVPNMAARRKRRQQQQERESQMSPPNFPKRESDPSICIVNYRSYTPRSQDVVREHLQRLSIADGKDHANGVDFVDASKESDSTQVSGEDSTSDNESSSHEKKHGEVSSLIHTLQATLKLDVKSNNRTSSEDSIDSDFITEFSPSASGRLKDRIKRLRKDCIEGVGEDVLRMVYHVIDNYSEDRVEHQLIQLMGCEQFENYSAQIWQLKFCEEFKL